MGIHVRVEARCDGKDCGVTITLRHKKHKVHIEQLRLKGWTYRHGISYCPNCSVRLDNEKREAEKRRLLLLVEVDD